MNLALTSSRLLFTALITSLLSALVMLPALAVHQLQTWRHTSPQGATYTYVYPQLPGKPTLNAKLKAAYLPTNAHIKDIDDLLIELAHEDGPTSSYDEEITGRVTLHNARVISVHYLGLGVLTPSAHPSKIIGALSLDLKTGRVLKLKDIIKPGALPLVKQAAIQALEPTLETGDIPEVSQAKDFDFYLTPKALVLINLFESHAIASVEAEIPRAKLKGKLLY